MANLFVSIAVSIASWHGARQTDPRRRVEASSMLASCGKSSSRQKRLFATRYSMLSRQLLAAIARRCAGANRSSTVTSLIIDANGLAFDGDRQLSRRISGI